MIIDSIRDISDFIFVENSLEKADVILVPGTSTHETVENASEIFKRGYGKYILVSGKYGETYTRFPNENISVLKYKGNYRFEYEFMREVLKQNNVPDKNIICEKEARNTLQNATKSKEILQQRNIVVRKAIICCQSYHARRALMTYQRVFTDVEIRVSSVSTRDITKDNWWKKRSSFKKVLEELEKCGKYWCNDWEEIYNELF